MGGEEGGGGGRRGRGEGREGLCMHNKQALILQILVQDTQRACSCNHCAISHCGSALEKNTGFVS